MSALPGHDRITQDEAQEEARTTEHDGPVSVNAPGRDLLAELEEAVAAARERQGRADREQADKDAAVEAHRKRYGWQIGPYN